jgi:SAM-dependent methyltransferase
MDGDPGEDAYARHLLRTQEEDEAATREGLEVWFDEALAGAAGRALDVGAGRGQGLDYLRDRGLAVEAWEPDPALARDLRARGDTVDDEPDPLAFLARQAGRFDLVFCKDVLEHLPPERALAVARAMGEALRPGGRLVVSVPHAVSFRGVYVRYADFTHRTAFTEESLRYVLERAGLGEVAFFAPRFRWTLRPTRLAYRALRRGWFAVLRGIYWLEHPSRRGQPAHFFPRLVASARRPAG